MVYKTLKNLNISFEYHEHPPVPTVEEASKYWEGIDSNHCKNLFFRNHKGNRHILVILDYKQNLHIHDLEVRLKQGKITFASPERMQKFLGVTPGSVSPFGLIHDLNHQVHLIIDENLQNAQRISFHPNLNTASLVLSFQDFIKFLKWTTNRFEFMRLYEKNLADS